MYPAPSIAWAYAMESDDRRIYVDIKSDQGVSIITSASADPTSQIVSLDLHRGIEPSGTLSVGGTIENWINLTIVGNDIAAAIEACPYIQLDAGVYVSGVPVTIPMGKFVTGPSRTPAFAGTQHEYTMYDFMGKFDHKFTPASTFPDQVATDLIAEICEHAGVLPPEDLEDWDELYVNPLLGYSMRAQIGWLFGLYGAHATIDRTGRLIPVWYAYNEQNEFFLSSDGIPNSSKVTVSRHTIAGVDFGSYYRHEVPAGVTQGDTDISGSNPYMWEARANAIFNAYYGRNYYDVGSVAWKGDLRMDPGDCMQIDDGSDDRGKRIPVQSVVFSFNGGLKSTITSNIENHSDQIAYNSYWGISNSERINRIHDGDTKTVGTAWTMCYSITFPANTCFTLNAQAVWSAGAVNAQAIGISTQSTAGNFLAIGERNTDMARASVNYTNVTLDSAETYYIWAKASQSGNLYVSFNGFQMPLS